MVIITKNILSLSEKITDTDKALFPVGSYANDARLTQRMSNVFLYPTSRSLIRVLGSDITKVETDTQISITFTNIRFIYKTTLNIISNVECIVSRQLITSNISLILLHAIDDNVGPVKYQIELMSTSEYLGIDSSNKAYYSPLAILHSIRNERLIPINITSYQLINILDDSLLYKMYTNKVFSNGIRLIENDNYDCNYILT
jgi:hypothetical protein